MEPANRQYRLELAKYSDNLSDVLRQLGENDLAQARSRQALDLLDALALPAPSLGIEQADAHNLRGQILQVRDARAAVTEYQDALVIFEKLGKDPTARRSASFHQRYDDLLLSLARFGQQSRDAGVHALLKRAVSAYLGLAEASLTSSSTADARLVLDNVSRLLPELPEADRVILVKTYQALADKMAARK